jgi:type II secretory pathway pseudopilin PulG
VNRLVSAARSRVQRHGADAGITLVELLVTTIITTILLAALGITFTSTLQASRASTTRTSATAEARLAMDVVAQRLRVAVRPPNKPSMFVAAGARSVSFYASLTSAGVSSPAPSLVDYSVDTTARCLRETVTPASGVAPDYTWTTGARTRCLGNGDLNPDGSPLFRYHTGVPQPTAADPTPAVTTSTELIPPSGGSLSDADSDRVHEVQIDVALRDRFATDTNPMRVSTRILLVNRLNEDLA